MPTSSHPIHYLLSLPSGMAREFAALTGKTAPRWFVSSDPAEARLGSGGGTAHLLHAALQAQGEGATLRQWLGRSRKLILHGGGQSRRLPAYAAVGKPLIPLPLVPDTPGQTPDQTLLDLQGPVYEGLLQQAPPGIVAMIASGDVLPRFGSDLPAFPDADVIALGMQVTPEVAHHFGVFFLPRHAPETLAFFLQKPSVARIQELSRDYRFLVDTGMWMLSERAALALMTQCGWDDARQEFAEALPSRYELYAEFGLGLGAQPTVQDNVVNALNCAVVPLPQPEFYHFGTSRQLIETVTLLQNAGAGPSAFGIRSRPTPLIQNAECAAALHPQENHTLWIENAIVPATWRLASGHILTGIPENEWGLTLEKGVCLDFAPIGEDAFCLRAYGLDDTFSGEIGVPGTFWFGRPAEEWLAARGLDWERAGIDPQTDIQQAALFPVLPADRIDPGFVEWLFACAPHQNERWAALWVAQPRLSAQEIGAQIQVERLYRQRGDHAQRNAPALYREHRVNQFFSLDLEATARLFARHQVMLPPDSPADGRPMDRVHDAMFRSALLRHRQEEGWRRQEALAFAHLRQNIIQSAQLAPVLPACRVLEDQIVWARSPVRLDLAGGWTDTPPYCMEHGGKVVNLAVNLNGQPPVQVFVRLCRRPELVIRSIDLGVEERVQTYSQLDTFAQAGSEFALAKAALALCGFLPRFHEQGGCPSLEQQLQDFGGGLEVSLLAAIPAGSGLGTSSILAATLLGALSEVCGLNWDRHLLLERTLIVEQMLTTGGGWQDQAGGLFRGIKLLETTPGLLQRPTLRWLPEPLFAGDYANSVNLLYYTGLTRMAKNILQEIVRRMFLNSAEQLRILREMGHHALATFDAVQRGDWDTLCAAVATSWELNQRLDSGTNTPAVQAILAPVQDYLAGTKLLGAGGGGYLLMLAKDAQAAAKIRQILKADPPNARARFVKFSLSETGLEVTRS